MEHKINKVLYALHSMKALKYFIALFYHFFIVSILYSDYL